MAGLWSSVGVLLWKNWRVKQRESRFNRGRLGKRWLYPALVTDIIIPLGLVLLLIQKMCEYNAQLVTPGGGIPGFGGMRHAMDVESDGNLLQTERGMMAQDEGDITEELTNQSLAILQRQDSQLFLQYLNREYPAATELGISSYVDKTKIIPFNNTASNEEANRVILEFPMKSGWNIYAGLDVRRAEAESEDDVSLPLELLALFYQKTLNDPSDQESEDQLSKFFSKDLTFNRTMLFPDIMPFQMSLDMFIRGNTTSFVNNEIVDLNSLSPEIICQAVDKMLDVANLQWGDFPATSPLGRSVPACKIAVKKGGLSAELRYFLANLITKAISGDELDTLTVSALPKRPANTVAGPLEGNIVFYLAYLFLWPYVRLVRDVVSEKEKQLKEYLMIMGLPAMSLLISWFLLYFFASAVVSLIGTWLLSGSMFAATTDGSVYFFLLLVTFVSSMLLFGLAITPIFTQTKTAAACAPLIYFVMSAGTFIRSLVGDDVVASNESLALLLVVLDGISSPVVFMATMHDILAFDAVTLAHRSITYHTVAEPCRLMATQSAGYLLLGWYLENVFPQSEYRRSQREAWADLLMTTLRKYVPNAAIVSDNKWETRVQLNDGEEKRFAELFRELETMKKNGILKRYAIAATDLEDVFVKVTEGEDVYYHAKDDVEDDTTEDSDPVRSKMETEKSKAKMDLRSTGIDRKLPGWKHSMSQLRALIIKRMKMSSRDKKSLFAQYVWPIGFFAILMAVLQHLLDSRGSIETVTTLTPSAKDASFFISSAATMTDSVADLVAQFEQNSHPILFDKSVTTEQDMLDAIARENSTTFFAGIFVSNVNWTADNTIESPVMAYSLYYNETVRRSLPVTLQWISQAYCKARSKHEKSLGIDNCDLVVKRGTFPIEIEIGTGVTTDEEDGVSLDPDEAVNVVRRIMVAFYLLMTMSSVVGFYIAPVVREKESGLKRIQYQHLETANASSLYWLSNFLFDYMVYTSATITICIILAIFSGCLTAEIIAAWFASMAIFGLAILPAQYLSSLVFASHSSAQSYMSYLSLFQIMAASIVFALSMVPGLCAQVNFVTYFLQFLPLYSFSTVVLNIVTVSWAPMRRQCLEVGGDLETGNPFAMLEGLIGQPKVSVWAWEVTGSCWFALVASDLKQRVSRGISISVRLDSASIWDSEQVQQYSKQIRRSIKARPSTSARREGLERNSILLRELEDAWELCHNLFHKNGDAATAAVSRQHGKTWLAGLRSRFESDENESLTPNKGTKAEPVIPIVEFVQEWLLQEAFARLETKLFKDEVTTRSGESVVSADLETARGSGSNTSGVYETSCTDSFGLADVFSLMEVNKQRFHIAQYSVSELSLERVFEQFTGILTWLAIIHKSARKMARGKRLSDDERAMIVNAYKFFLKGRQEDARLHSSGGPTRRVKAPTLPRHRWLRNDEAALEVMKMKT
ncbi:hypothetical protein PC119_g23497 [Phytophthora cactorum]|nr:hypothetical protein PC119_g23497 [Phytophthora cactorum]